MYTEFVYRQPESLEECIRVISEPELNYVLYAGGTDLLVLMRKKIAQPSEVIDIKKIDECRGIRLDQGSISIGSCCTFYEIANNKIIKEKLPALAEAAEMVGSTPIRFKATLGGNIINASPAGDGFTAAYGLGAEVELTSQSGIRRVMLDQFIFGPRATDLQKGEILTRILIPGDAFTHQAFFKVGRRNALAISVVNGLVGLRLQDRIIEDCSIVLGAVAPTPVHIKGAEEYLKGKMISSSMLSVIPEIVGKEINPITDLRASAEYRSYIAGIQTKRALEAIIKECES